MKASPAFPGRRTWCLDACRAGLTLLLAAHAPRQAAANDGLEGRRFDTQAGMVGKPAHVPSDILSFAGGLFHSSDCDQYDYGKGRYTSRIEPDGSIRFEAETVSPSYGRNVWKGRVRGRSIEGEFIFYRKPTWWRPDPEPLPHWFKGPEVDAAGKPISQVNVTTAQGLRVKAALDENTYDAGVKITDAEFAAIDLERDEFHGEWNYRVKPRGVRVKA